MIHHDGKKNTHGILSAFNERVNHSANFPHVGGRIPGWMNLGELPMVWCNNQAAVPVTHFHCVPTQAHQDLAAPMQVSMTKPLPPNNTENAHYWKCGFQSPEKGGKKCWGWPYGNPKLDQTMGAADWKLNIQQLQYTFQRQLCGIPNLSCQDHTRSIKYRIYPYLSITSSWDPMLCIGDVSHTWATDTIIYVQLWWPFLSTRSNWISHQLRQWNRHGGFLL